jgi:hypothetical protein
MTKSQDEQFVVTFLNHVKENYRYDSYVIRTTHFTWRQLRALAGTINELRHDKKVLQLRCERLQRELGSSYRDSHEVFHPESPEARAEFWEAPPFMSAPGSPWDRLTVTETTSGWLCIYGGAGWPSYSHWLCPNNDWNAQ